MTQAHSITMLGTGLIGDFYTMTLHGQRGRDRVAVVYSRPPSAARRSRSGGHAARHDQHGGRVNDPETDTVIVGLPNDLHEKAVSLAAAGRARRSSAPSRWPRRAEEATPCSTRWRRRACSPATSRTWSTRRRR